MHHGLRGMDAPAQGGGGLARGRMCTGGGGQKSDLFVDVINGWAQRERHTQRERETYRGT